MDNKHRNYHKEAVISAISNMLEQRDGAKKKELPWKEKLEQMRNEIRRNKIASIELGNKTFSEKVKSNKS